MASIYFLILTAFYCFRILRGHGIFYEERIIKNGFFLFFLLTLVLAFEEISWGQRVFNIATPYFIRKINIQNEITLHNISAFQRYRHWLLLLFGCTGLTLIHLGVHVYKIDVKFLFLSPPAFFKTAFVFILISGIVLDMGYIFKEFYPGYIATTFSFWAGRYSEIGELGVSITAFSYAFDKFDSILSRTP